MVTAPLGVIPKKPPDGAKKTVQSQTFIIGKLFVQAITASVQHHSIFQVPSAVMIYTIVILSLCRALAKTGRTTVLSTDHTQRSLRKR
jgi:hypothetical protein